MASIKVKFRPSAVADHEGTIYYQIIHERSVRQWRTDYKVFKREWDSRKATLIITAETTRRNYLKSIRERIQWDTNRLRRVVADLTTHKGSFSTDEIIEEFSCRQNEQSFFHFMESIITRLKELGKKRTSETYTSALNSLKRFRNDKDIILDGFDSELMESYEAYLSGIGLIPNSISFHLRILRAVYNRAAEKGITENKHPFRHVYTGVDKTTKRAIDLQTLKRIKDVDLTMWPKADYARDLFILSFYFRGMSFVDMAYLRKCDLKNGKLIYRRRKTGQQLTIKWSPEMEEIIQKYPQCETEYLLPIITSTSASPYNQYRTKQYLINKWLKVVASLIGLKMPLTLYCSRHSWASIAKAKGIPIGVISDGLGHDSEQTTQIYLSTLDTNAVDKANALIMKSL